LRRALWLGLWYAAGIVHAADLLNVEPELWDRPRTAHAVYEQPAVKQAVAAYFAQPDAQMVIHHAIAPESVLQAEELRAWLMALAVDAARIRLVNDLPSDRPLAIEVTR
jgi:hypothetical protein